jgi:deoxyribonuclease IV
VKRIKQFTATRGAAKGENANKTWRRPRKLEARDGIEPSVKVLQTYALPLGYRAPNVERRTNHIIAPRPASAGVGTTDTNCCVKLAHEGMAARKQFARANKRRLRNCPISYKMTSSTAAGGFRFESRLLWGFSRSGNPEGMAEDNDRFILTFDAADEYRPEPPPAPEIPAWKNGSIRIGIHTSIAGDISGALEIAHGLGANALQIFSASPRMWMGGASRISEADATRFRERRKELGLGPVVIHDNYLINLASPDPVLRTRSVQAFHQEIVRAMALGADYLVAHPGSGRESERSTAISAIAQGLRQAARGLKMGELQILLENTAGQGSSVGSRFEELRDIIQACTDLPLGVCVDTAHIFAAGFDIRTAEGLEATLQTIDRTVGLARVAVVHVNDSKAAFASRVDRHEHIGHGKIGLEAFGRILNHPLLAGRAFILETPIDKPGDDRRNVAALWKLVGREVTASGNRDGMKPRRKQKKAASAKSRRARAKKSHRRAAKRTRRK